MIIECDTRQQKDKHITNYFDENGIRYIRNKLYCGDYKRVDSTEVIIDTKKSLLELAGNLCRTTEHQRIKKEIEKACDLDCERFIFLIADSAITSVDKVHDWRVPRNKNGELLTKVRPEVLEKIMITMQDKYGVEFQFCKKKEMGQKIVELLKNV